MKKIQGFYVRALNSQKIYAKSKSEHCKFQPAMFGPILKIQNVFKSVWWDLSSYEIS